MIIIVINIVIDIIIIIVVVIDMMTIKNRNLMKEGLNGRSGGWVGV